MKKSKRRLFLTIFCAVFVAILLFFHWFLSSVHITKAINKIAADNIKTELKFDSITLYFFSTFPDMEIILSDGYLSMPDSMNFDEKYKVDNLLDFKRAHLIISPIDYFFRNRLSIKKIEVQDANIYARVSKDGRIGWDVFKSQSEKDSVESNYRVVIDEFAIKNSQLSYDNRITDTFIKADSCNTSFAGDFSPERLSLETSISTKSMLVWFENEILTEGIALKLDSHIRGRASTQSVTLDSAKLKVDNLELDVRGFWSVDTINVDMSANSDNLDRLVSMIPHRFIDNSVKFKTTGKVKSNINISGRYSNGAAPVAKGEFLLKNGSIKFEGFKYGIDDIDTEVDLFIDFAKLDNSVINVHNSYFKGGDNLFEFEGAIYQPIINPIVKGHGKCDLNLSQLSEIFPLSDSISVTGRVALDGNFNVDVNQVLNDNYATVDADLNILLDSIDIDLPMDTIFLRTKRITADVSRSKSAGLTIKSKIADTDIILADLISANIGSTAMNIFGISESDSTSYVKGNVTSNNIDIFYNADSIDLFTTKLGCDFIWSKEYRELIFKSDSLNIANASDNLVVTYAFCNINNKRQLLNGMFSFRNLALTSELIAEPIKMVDSRLDFVDSDMHLQNAKFLIGNSDFELTGTVRGIKNAVDNGGDYLINARMFSNHIDVNELSTIYSEDGAFEQDSLMTVFTLPSNIDLEMDIIANSVTYKELQIENAIGDILVDNSRLRLEGLVFDAVGASIHSTLEYWAMDTKSAKSSFVLNSNHIDISSAIKLLPNIDSVMPMMKSLVGKVSLDIAASTSFDSLMNVDINSLTSAVEIVGDSITFADSKVLDEISKELKFKKNDSKVIESINVKSVIEDGKVTIYPFILDINRYKLAISGQHNLDNKMNYHISVIKSPVPFKLGLDVSGTPEDYKIKLTKAKNKRIVDPVVIKEVSSGYFVKWNDLSKRVLK